MLHDMFVTCFKCFRDVQLPLRPLTVFCGPNGVGKSSAIQALLLTKQACKAKNNQLRLNGVDGLNLGIVANVLHNGGGDSITFAYHFAETGEKEVLALDFENVEQQYLNISRCGPALKAFFASPNSRAFTYLAADRQGPRDIQPTQSRSPGEQQIGIRGEYTAELLAAHENSQVREAMCHPDSNQNRRLIRQVELWMGELVPGIAMKVARIPGTNAVTLFFKKAGIEADWRRQENEGFGISYSLPIIVAGLLAPPGGLFLVDSPEAHLHPAAHSKLTQFLAQLAATGVQVILETHSDHVLNGIRLAAVNESSLLREQVIINFLSGDPAKPHLPLTITQSGSLSDWPKGFFDQSEKDLAAIVKARRKNVRSR